MARMLERINANSDISFVHSNTFYRSLRIISACDRTLPLRFRTRERRFINWIVLGTLMFSTLRVRALKLLLCERASMRIIFARVRRE